MIIWTYFRDSFSFGRTQIPTGFEADTSTMERTELGKGYFGYVFVSDSGKSIVAESTTGAIIGNSVNEVRKDIEEADDEIMRKQIENAMKEVETVRRIEKSAFWETYCGA